MDPNKPSSKFRAAEEEVMGSGGGGAAKFQSDISDAKRFLDVTDAMMQAGGEGKSRVVAGLAKWFEQRKRRGGPSHGGHPVGDALRFLGKPGAAIWIDRFFGTMKPGSKGGRGGRGGGGGGDGGGDGGISKSRMSGHLLKIELRLGTLKSTITDMNDDIADMGDNITDIKQLLSPKIITAKGYSKKDKPLYGDWRDLDLFGKRGDEHRGTPDAIKKGLTFPFRRDPTESVQIQYDPMAPEGNQFRIVTKSGKLGKKPGAGFMNSAMKQASIATAKIVLKEDKKSRKQERKELEQKQREKERDPLLPDDPVSILRDEMDEKFDKGFKILKEFKEATGGDGIISMFNPGKLGLYTLAGLVGSLIGWEVGVWLNHHFGISDAIVDAISPDYDPNANPKSARRSSTARRRFGKGQSASGRGWGTGRINRSGEASASQSGAGGPTQRPSGMLKKDTIQMEGDALAVPKEGMGLLDMIAQGEEDKSYGYNSIVGSGEFGGPESFSDFSQHPNAIGVGLSKKNGGDWLDVDDPKKKDWSTAAGRYQLTFTDWKRLRSRYKLTENFGPENQDLAAWYLARERYETGGKHLLTDLRAGKIREILRKLNKTWTSLEGGSESHHPSSYYKDVQQNYLKAVQKRMQETSAVMPSSGIINSQSRPRVAQANRSTPDSAAIGPLMAQQINPASATNALMPVVVNKNIQNNNMVRQPIQSASIFSNDPSFIRAASKDVLHPVNA